MPKRVLVLVIMALLTALFFCSLPFMSLDIRSENLIAYLAISLTTSLVLWCSAFYFWIMFKAG